MEAFDKHALVKDFLAWSGGFQPESIYQITVYLDYACDAMLYDDEVRNFLVTWMNHPDSIECSLEF
ncbi:MAG: hypothetical protein WD851_09570 [Pirellulales bacterium]